MNLRVRGPSQQITLTGIEPESSVSSFQTILAEKTGVPAAQQELLSGFPPQPLTLPTDRDTATVASLGLQTGDVLTLRQNTAPVALQQPPPAAAATGNFSVQGMSEDEQLARAIAASLGESFEPQPQQASVAPPAPPKPTPTAASVSKIATLNNTSSSTSTSLYEAIGDGTAVARRIVADDNSCLFSAVGYVTQHTRTVAQSLRSVIAQEVISDPFEYNEAVLGKDPAEYASWITNPKQWGGAIELSIFSKKMGLEIAAFDVQTQRVDIYGQDSGYRERVMLIYDGLHYDALAVASGLGGPENKDVTKLASSGERTEKVMAAARRLVEKFHKNRQFTDTANFTLKCGVCGIGLKGEKEAVEHAKLTQHASFSEY